MHRGILMGIVAIIILGAVAYISLHTTTNGVSQSDSDALTDVSAQENTAVYKSESNEFTFVYPKSLTVTPVATHEVKYIETTETVPLPTGSVEISSVGIISPILNTEFNLAKPIYDYDSGSTGRRFWYDATKTEWQAQTIFAGAQGSEFTALSLQDAQSQCSLMETFGNNTYYKIKSGDEGVPTEYYYFLMTNKGYALRFMSQFDLMADYSTYPAELQPDPKAIATAKEILASVTLQNGVQEVSAQCK